MREEAGYRLAPASEKKLTNLWRVDLHVPDNAPAIHDSDEGAGVAPLLQLHAQHIDQPVGGGVGHQGYP